MRLTCPNCSAQYEVPVEAIPPAGRDVQCSACQHTWFESGPPPEPLRDEELWDKVPRVENDDEESDDLAEVATAPPPVAPPRPALKAGSAGATRTAFPYVGDSRDLRVQKGSPVRASLIGVAWHCLIRSRAPAPAATIGSGVHAAQR